MVNDSMIGEAVKVEIKGLDELLAKMEALPFRLARKGIRNALLVAGGIIKWGFINFAPKRTGFLASHFNVKLRLMGKDLLAGTAYVGPQGKMDYPDRNGGYREKTRKKDGVTFKVGRIAVASVARFLEFGTSKLAKNPFMTRAFETYKNTALAAMIEALKNALEDAAQEGK